MCIGEKNGAKRSPFQLDRLEILDLDIYGINMKIYIINNGSKVPSISKWP